TWAACTASSGSPAGASWPTCYAADVSGSMSGSAPDATGPFPHQDRAVTVPRRVVIELDAGPDPIAGLLLMDGSGHRRVEGYTQLIAALEAARAEFPREDADKEEDSG